MTIGDAERVVHRFVEAWERRDIDELLDFFTDDAYWHPMPMKPAVGKNALRQLVSEWLRTGPKGEIQRQVSDGRVVMHERIDRCSFHGRDIEEPVAAVFEIDNGRITAWREYFDTAPFARPPD
jgi:limonene-1,2-epoxide hydrolase